MHALHYFEPFIRTIGNFPNFYCVKPEGKRILNKASIVALITASSCQTAEQEKNKSEYEGGSTVIFLPCGNYIHYQTFSLLFINCINYYIDS